jgi:hypothetical protein
MCDYCEKDKPIFENEDVLTGWPGWFDDEHLLTRKEFDAFTYKQGVVIDSRGYLRLVHLDDFDCLDHGQNVEINFCPFCGKALREEPKNASR